MLVCFLCFQDMICFRLLWWGKGNKRFVYSTKIADMLLRTVSEIENISKELCWKENIKFYDSKRHIRKIVYFNDYYTSLEEEYGLSDKLVDYTFDNCTMVDNCRKIIISGGGKHMDDRKRMGNDKEGVIFPIAPNISEMGETYLQFIDEIKHEIQNQRISVVLKANASMICLYWNIGNAILKKQQKKVGVQR